jgi:hypothetical protein
MVKLKAFIAFIILLQTFAQPPCANARENAVYIWQRNWRPEMELSIKAVESSDQFKPLAGDLKIENKRVVFSKVPLNWGYLKGKKVVADIRMQTDLSTFLKAKDQGQIAGYLAKSVSGIVSEAEKSGVDIKGIELDYDCPTAKLADFERFLKAFRQELKDTTLSITALPTWMGSPAFRELISSVDYYVLQIHSFELPKNKNAPQYIFPKDRAAEYFDRAVAFAAPFYVSLPTYGYEVAYSKDDEFIGLRAEGGVQYYAEGIKKNMAFSDPKDIVDFLLRTDASKAEIFLGVCWFRLPVPSDRFNWDITTFQRVVKREVPRGHLSLQVVKKDGVKEVFLVNDGELNFSADARFDILWDAEPLFDVVGGFDYVKLPDGKGLTISGEAPRVSHKKMVAWFRMPGGGEANILNGEVTGYEKK